AAGVKVRLPHDWRLQLDYSWSDNRYDAVSNGGLDGGNFRGDLEAGMFNPFVDTNLYPIDVSHYVASVPTVASSTLDEVSLRASGMLPALGWSVPQFTVGLSYRIAKIPELTSGQNFPLTPDFTFTGISYARQQSTGSAYAELLVPLVKPGAL